MNQEKIWVDDDLDKLEINAVRSKLTDVLEQAAALPMWSQDYTQLDKGQFSGTVTSVACQGVQIFREGMNRSVDELASAPPDSYVIGLPTIVEGNALWCGSKLNKNSLITLDKNDELLFRTSHSSEINAAVISEQRLEEYAERVEKVDLRHLMKKVNPVERLPPAIQSRLLAILYIGTEHMAKNIQDGVSHPNSWRQFEDSVFGICIEALSAVSSNNSRQHEYRVHRYIVKSVRELTLAQHCDPITIGDICTSLNISRRTLNHAFQQVLGITPVTYMRNIRLHKIRAELQYQSELVNNIACVASHWGFWHMSLFARYYRELFGECPSETLERSRQ
ncbi:helix-turn-helix domain-containing protein [Methylophaga thalassica]|uniref:helix-turn-helix domain-containing protein n=1 Tax=Methylophaga thalassica TaxID=40223 RepID=UPI002E7AC828|nr:helix-turn-helix domain-containing protein [Methylophaga thalassica]WVI85089.1 helix-turn-helix domain-containing protein [Methylophaga thalassica]